MIQIHTTCHRRIAALIFLCLLLPELRLPGPRVCDPAVNDEAFLLCLLSRSGLELPFVFGVELLLAGFAL